MAELDERKVSAAGIVPDATMQRHRLSRDRIIQTALRLMDEEGLEALSMRRIGRELGVEAMSLYNYVRDKEDLLDGVTEAVMAEFRWEPTSEHWVEQGRAVAREWRRLVKLHPNIVLLLVERKHPMSSATMLRPTEIALEILRRAGLSERDTVHAFQAIGSYIFGIAMMETGYLAPGRPEAPGEMPHGDLAGALGQDFPCLAQMLPWFIECDMDATFELGLDLLLEGIRAKASASD
jgi:AcrR family transcriptional regulator